MRSCKNCVFLHRQLISRTPGKGADVYWYYCRHPQMLARGEKGRITGIPGKQIGSRPDRPDWCPLGVFEWDDVESGDLRYDYESRLTGLARRIAGEMDDEDGDDDD